MGRVPTPAAHREDPVRRLIQRAQQLLAGAPERREVDALLAELQRLSARELIRFDRRSRGSVRGFAAQRIARLRRPLGSRAGRRLWSVLALVSADGRERERAAGASELSPLTARLLALRAADWVAPVGAAALDRLAGVPASLLVDALAVADRLGAEHLRGEELRALLERRLSDDDLRGATRAADAGIRRAAWRWLADRDALRFDELHDRAARDGDVAVRALAAAALDRLPAEQRRVLADRLLADASGVVAAPALAALVALDGVAPIERGLGAPSVAVRRAARAWAAIRGVDARAAALARLGECRSDRAALTALAELADVRDAGLFAEMLGDERMRVRAAGLRALARVDEAAARRAALDALRAGTPGRMSRAAADVLRGRPLGEPEKAVAAAIALDPARPARQRLRALNLLRTDRWMHLAVALEARATTDDPAVRAELDHVVAGWASRTAAVGRAPTPDVRSRIDRHLDTLAPGDRATIAFVLRTARAN